jgi:spermidine synthase
MKPRFLLGLAVMGLFPATLQARVIYEITSTYHHIRVVDQAGIRTLFFDNAPQTQLALQDPLKGHFEYTEFFHLAWLWNPHLTNALMIGLGGGSAQRAFAHYYPDLTLQTVEIDPAVLQVARDYFEFKETPRQQVAVSDGRVFLRRSQARYDLIVLDAYVEGRYGSSIPQHLATKEFFELVRDHLSTNGVLAYNVIGSPRNFRADLIGAIHRTISTAFPQVYVFQAVSSQNVVLIATRARGRFDLEALRRQAGLLVQVRRVTMPTFRQRLESLQTTPLPSAAVSPVLTDDFAPVEGLAGAK